MEVQSLSWIGLVDPRLEVLRTDVGLPACLVGEKALYHYLHLRLCWDIIYDLKGVNMNGRQLTRGDGVLSLVEGGVVLCDLSHVVPERAGRSGGCMLVPEFEDCV